MRKLFLLISLVMFSGIISGQERNFLIVEMMEVDNVQEGDYWETEAFWEKIHNQRVKVVRLPDGTYGKKNLEEKIRDISI